MGSFKCYVIWAFALFVPILADQPKIVCNYETKAHLREGQGKFQVSDLDPALDICTHLQYGYAAINDDTLKLVPLNEQFDVIKDNYRKITDLKARHPKLKTLLSVGGNEDVTGEGSEKNLKYRELLESSTKRIAFANSAYTLVKSFGFDGIDLAWEFPENKPKKVHSTIGKLWKSFKKTFSGDSVLDEKASEHKDQFVALVRELKNAFKADNYLVSLTVLPNVNSSIFYDPRNLAPNLDFVTIQCFDYYTPQRTPEIADYPAPLYELIDRRPDENCDAQVKFWLSNGFPASKILLGIPTYGRSWQLTSDAKVDTVPPEGLDGPGEPGPYTKETGILSYPEICMKIGNPHAVKSKSSPLDFKIIPDATKKRGVFAYRLPAENQQGMWIGYESPETAATKAEYVKAKGLGGVAIDDLTMDDFKGVCGYNRFAILQSVRSTL